MASDRSILERQMERVELRPFTLDGFHRRRDRKQRNRRIAAGVVALVVAAAGVGGLVRAFSSGTVPADDSSEQLGIFEPVAGRILYVNGIDRGYGRGLWAVDPNGPSDTTDGPSVADDVASTLVPLELDGTPLGWSSDGTELLLMRSVGDGLLPEQYLSILHADGSETRLNEEPMGISSATISPDGTRVVFAGQYDLSGLHVIDAEGGRPLPLPIPQATEGASDPTFSPDGTQIAYLAGNGEAEVWVANADGTDAHEILADEPTVFRGLSGPVWSPAGDRLAIGLGTHERSGGSIYTFAPDGSDFTEVIVGGSSPYWSPDGSQIAYTIQCDDDPTFTCAQFDPQAGSSPAGLAIADADGSNVRAFGFAASGPWHPGDSAPLDETAPDDSFARANGEVLSFTGVPLETPGDLVAVNPATGEQRVLVEDLGTVYSARWSADGRWVAYETDGPDAYWQLWVADGSQEPRVVAEGGPPDIFTSLGLYFAFGDGSEAEREVRIRVAAMDGAAPAEIGSLPFVGCTYNYKCGLTWSPDGSQIAFHKDDGLGVTVFDANGAGEAEPIDELTYASWAGGSYACACP